MMHAAHAYLHPLCTRMALALACALVAIAALCALPAPAWADFTVYVGYSGGPYYEKARYSDAQMSAMADTTLYQYTSFDSMPSLRKGFAYGVRLESLFSNASVSIGELKRFYFSTEDGYIADDGVEGYGAWYYGQLVGTPRYYFPNLINTYDFEDQALEDYDAAWEGAEQVPSVLAVSSSFSRVSSQTDAAWTSTAYMTGGYRLLFGQTDPAVGDARAYASVIKSMTCIFDGTPTISFDSSTQDQSFEAKVGDTITIKAPTITAADSLIEEYGKYDINWSVSDVGVADFVRDEDGNVIIDKDGNVQLKIVGEGEVSISASYGNSPSSEYRTTASLSGKGTGSGSGDGEGSGDDDDDSGEGGGSSGGQSSGSESSSGIGESDDDYEASVIEAGTSASEATVSQASAESISGAEAAGASGSGGQQAWKVTATGSQDAMVDDLLFGSPMAVAIAIFGLFVCGFIGRVILTERQKDPYVDERLKG